MTLLFTSLLAEAATAAPSGAGDASAVETYPDAITTVIRFFLSGGFFMLLIIACSALAACAAIWKALELRRNRIIPAPLAEAITTAHTPSDAHRIATATGDDTVLDRIAAHASSGDFTSKEEAQISVEAKAREEVVHMETGIPLLEVVITIAPLLGLLGTVKGLVGVFSTVGAAGDLGGDPTRIALGIAEALNTTIAGLAVAVPTVVAHSYFTSKIEKLAVRMEVLTGKLLAARFRQAPPSPAPDTHIG